MKKLLITGASGFLGWHLCQEAQRQGWHVHGTRHTHPVQISGVVLHTLDLTDVQALKGVLNDVNPDAVIHCAARARPNDCQVDPEGSYGINVTASINLATLCRDRAIAYTFISTEQVFDGLNAPYHESDPVSPINIYGEQKVAAEQGILVQQPTALICRMPLLFGVAPTAPSFLQGLLQKLRSGDQINLFVDEFRTPVSGCDAAKGILLALNQTQGLLHLGGVERLSRYAFGQKLVAAVGTDESCLHPGHQADLKFSAPRAPDLTLDSARALTMGYAPDNVTDALKKLTLT
ncbi:MAG: SDR family oxidoreductase [Cyanobacteria bacterium P01_A01_bin.123]